MKPERFTPLKRAVEIANDVVAFDHHIFFFFEEDHLELPRLLWHYQHGPILAGPDFRRLTSQVELTRSRAAASENCGANGLIFGKSRRLLLPLSYDNKKPGGRKHKGYVIFSRHGGSTLEFSATDRRLLNAATTLGLAAMYDPDVESLLQRLHIEFLHRRAALQQSSSTRLVLAEYLRKCRYVFHPLESTAVAKSWNGFGTRCFAALANYSRTALHVVAATSGTTPTNLSGGQTKPIYAHDKSNVVSACFRTNAALLSRAKNLNESPAKREPATDCDRMILPVAAGVESVIAVLFLQSDRVGVYNDYTLHAGSLLAAHCANPLGKALGRELAERRLRDSKSLTELISHIQECNDWGQIRQTLANELPKLDYHCGLISRVDHVNRLVIGEHAWATEPARHRQWEALRRATKRHFRRDRNDCQIKATLDKEEQVIYDPARDRSVNRIATQLAAIGPFAIIPIIDSSGTVTRTLHVERSDFAPLDAPEINNLKQICRCASSVAERLEDFRHNTKESAVTKHWSQILQRRFARREDVLRAFADFMYRYGMAARCRIFEIAGNRQTGIYYSGSRLTKIEKFQEFELSRASRWLLKSLRTEKRVMLCIPRKHLGGDLRSSEFHVLPVWPVPQRERLGKRGEWLEVPFIVEDELVAKAVLDKSSGKAKLKPSPFSSREIRLVSTLGRLASLAIERTDLECSLLHLAVIGASDGIFRHEIQNRLRELDAVIAESIKTPPGDNLRWAIFPKAVMQEIGDLHHRIEALNNFFSKQLPKNSRKANVCLIANELTDARRYLPKLTDAKIKLVGPKKSAEIRPIGTQRPLCLILLQLLQNAFKHGEGPVRVRHSVEKRFHLIEVSDNGKGVDLSLVAEMNRTGLSLRSDSIGVGLHTTKLLAASQGWRVRITQRAKPTTFSIEIPR